MVWDVWDLSQKCVQNSYVFFWAWLILGNAFYQEQRNVPIQGWSGGLTWNFHTWKIPNSWMVYKKNNPLKRMIWGSPILRNLHRVFFPTCLLNSFDFLMADLSHTLRFRCGVQDGKLPISTANLWPEKKMPCFMHATVGFAAFAWRGWSLHQPFISPSSFAVRGRS